MRVNRKAKGLLARKMEDPAYRKRHEESYELFKLEVQFLNALERKHWTYADLAKVMHTQKSGISRDLKGGGLQSASIDRVARMAEALGLRFFSFCVPEEKADQVLPVITRLAAA
jgi:transcriptional regulator with XRE-family HTH domain